MKLIPALKAAYLAATDRRYRYYYSQRRIEDHAARRTRAERLTRILPTPAREPGPLASDLTLQGIAFIEDLALPNDVREMRAYFERCTSYDPYRPECGRFTAPSHAPSGTHVAYFDHEAVANAPHVLRIANDERVLGAVEATLGVKPTIAYMMAWWSMPSGKEAQHAELFHRDYDDYRFAKLFLYLTDVDEATGPHAFVRRSHISSKLAGRLRFSEQDVRDNFPAEDHLILTGKAGTAFIENTFGLHRGIPPRDGPRLIFQVLYAMQPYYGGPCSPVRDLPEDGPSLDPYINRVYCRDGCRPPRAP